MYPPRYRSDNKHWGRFMQKKTSATHMQTVMPGTVSLKKVNMVDSFQLLTNDLKGKILTIKINNSDFSKSFFFISINTGQRKILLVKFVLRFFCIIAIVFGKG